MCKTLSLNMLEKNGTLFVTPQTLVYPGMIIGEAARPADLDVNPCKEKKLTRRPATLRI